MGYPKDYVFHSLRSGGVTSIVSNDLSHSVVAMGELGQQHKSTQYYGGFIRSSLLLHVLPGIPRGVRVTKSVTVLISVFTECFLRDTPQTRFILCSIKTKTGSVSEAYLKHVSKGTQQRKLHRL